MAYLTADEPLIVSEFLDPDGREYCAIVNNSQTTMNHVYVAFGGTTPRLYQIDWLGKEQEVANLAGARDYARFEFWLSPGQMQIFRVADTT